MNILILPYIQPLQVRRKSPSYRYLDLNLMPYRCKDNVMPFEFSIWQSDIPVNCRPPAG